MMSTPPLLFLYQTRTILRCRRLPSVSRALHGTTTSLHQHKADNDIPFAQDGSSEHATGEAQPKGTITPTERQTFDRIFTDIASRGLKPRMGQDVPHDVARRATNLIFDAAAASDVGPTPRGEAISPAQYASAAKDKEKALLRFPPSLRAAASRAFELLNPDHPASYLPQNTVQATESKGGSKSESKGIEVYETWKSPKNSFMRMVEIDAKRQPEQRRVEALMAAATTDFELWDLMEQEVFSYPGKLGLLGEVATVEPAGKGKRKGQGRGRVKKTTPPAPASVPTQSQSDSDPKLNLYIYGPLYPSLLLFGLRRLDRGFATPSPLTSSILPRIKELGLESFVLGVSTPFYNELLNICYSRHGDLSKMIDLLDEMSHSGLYFDQSTAAILDKAYDETNAMATGMHGTFAQALMTMPAYEKSVRDRIKYWHSNVDFSIAQRDSDIDYTQLLRN